MPRESITILQPLPKPEAKGGCAPSDGSAAAFDAGVWFQSAASGLWYQAKNAGGDISAVKVDGVIYKRQNVELSDRRENNQ